MNTWRETCHHQADQIHQLGKRCAKLEARCRDLETVIVDMKKRQKEHQKEDIKRKAYHDTVVSAPAPEVRTEPEGERVDEEERLGTDLPDRGEDGAEDKPRSWMRRLIGKENTAG